MGAVVSMISYDEQKERPVILGEYIIETRSTVRAAAKKFGISKSTVHTEVTNLKMMWRLYIYKVLW